VWTAFRLVPCSIVLGIGAQFNQGYFGVGGSGAGGLPPNVENVCADDDVSLQSQCAHRAPIFYQYCNSQNAINCYVNDPYYSKNTFAWHSFWIGPYEYVGEGIL